VTFQYIRWLFPVVEYTEDKRWSVKAQRFVFITLFLSIIGAALWDGLKLAF